MLRTALLLLQVIQAPRVQSGVEVRPDTVTVGQPFQVLVHVRVPRGAMIEFPETTDSTGEVQSLDPAQVSSSPDSVYVDQTAVYRVAAWNVGALDIPLLDVVVRDSVQTRHVHLTSPSVWVKSVLPADSAQRTPKPPRDVITFGPPWWLWLVAAIVAVAIIRLIVWLWRRRKRRVPVPLDPYVVASQAFAHVESLGLVAAGERAQHCALMADVLRQYIWAVTHVGEPSLTTSELLVALKPTQIPTQRLAALVTEIDLVKFARRPLSAERAMALAAETRAVVDLAHAFVSAPPMDKAA